MIPRERLLATCISLKYPNSVGMLVQRLVLFKISSPKAALKELLASDESENDSDSTVDDTTDAANTLLSVLRE